jgi:hypothetical protein
VSDEERDLTPQERALVRVRQAAFAALEAGAPRESVDREVADAKRVHDRLGRSARR